MQWFWGNMLVMFASRVARRVLPLLLIVFSTAVIVFVSGLAAWIWLAFGPGPG